MFDARCGLLPLSRLSGDNVLARIVSWRPALFLDRLER